MTLLSWDACEHSASIVRRQVTLVFRGEAPPAMNGGQQAGELRFAFLSRAIEMILSRRRHGYCQPVLGTWTGNQTAIQQHPKTTAKTDAGNGSYGICRVIDASRSPAPDPRRWPIDTMSQFSHLLRKAADEVRDYCRTSPDAASFGIEWLQSLAQRMEAASSFDSDAAIEREMDALAYSIIDSGPLTGQFAPSFNQALDALQRLRKRGARA